MDCSPSHFSLLSSARSAMSSHSGIAMRKYGDKPAKVGGIDTQGWRQFLKARHPTKTAQAIAARTGLSPDTIDKWLRGTGAPSFDATMILAVIYGPEFLAACVPGCAWIAEAARGARRLAIGETIATLEAERDRLLERR